MKWRALLGVLVAFGGFAVPAQAQSVREGYGGRADVLGEVGTVEAGEQPAGAANKAQPNAAPVQSQPAQQTIAGDALPFTGADVILLLLGGLTLVGAGLVMRRMSYRGSTGTT